MSKKFEEFKNEVREHTFSLGGIFILGGLYFIFKHHLNVAGGMFIAFGAIAALLRHPVSYFLLAFPSLLYGVARLSSISADKSGLAFTVVGTVLFIYFVYVLYKWITLKRVAKK